jgi:hypothetical protein
MPLDVVIVPDSGITPRSGLAADAAAWQADLAASKVRLYGADMPGITQNTTRAALEAAEVAYDGYTAGGIAVAAMNDPFRDDDGSFVCISPVTQFNYVDGVGHVSAVAKGFWVEDANGNVRVAKDFPEPVSLASNDDGVPVVFGRRFSNPD